METVEVLLVVGSILRDASGQPDMRVIAGSYGNAMQTDGGYAIADPCYLLRDDDYTEFNATRLATFGARESEVNTDRKLVRMTGWHEMLFQGEPVFWRDTGGDGDGPLGLCIDSGWVAVIPVALCSVPVQKILKGYV